MSQGYQPIGNIDTNNPPSSGSAIKRPVQQTKQIELKLPDGPELDSFIKLLKEELVKPSKCEIMPAEPEYIPTSKLIEMLKERLTPGLTTDGILMYCFDESNKYRVQIENKYAAIWHDIENPRRGPATVFIVRG